MPVGLNSPMGMQPYMNRPMGAGQGYMNRPMGGQGMMNVSLNPQPMGYNPLAPKSPKPNPTPRAPRPQEPTLAPPMREIWRNPNTPPPPPPGEMRSVLPRSQRPPGSKGWDDYEWEQKQKGYEQWKERNPEPNKPVPKEYQDLFGYNQPAWMRALPQVYGPPAYRDPAIYNPQVLRGLYT